MRIEDIRPEKDEYAPYFEKYISLISEGELFEVLEEQVTKIVNMFFLVDEAGGAFRYAEGKWTIKEVLGHIIDAERVFAYRLLCLSRNDKTSLPSFNENEYVKEAGFGERSLIGLVEELRAVRQSTIHLIKSFSQLQLERKGNVSGKEISVRAIILILIGHLAHHVDILNTRYNI